MKCPVCTVDLKIAERQGVEIDYCPQCRGVWLDRGELDKIIDRVGVEEAPPRETMRRDAPPRETMHRDAPAYDERRRDVYRHGDDDDSHYYHKKKKRGILGELFDF